MYVHVQGGQVRMQLSEATADEAELAFSHPHPVRAFPHDYSQDTYLWDEQDGHGNIAHPRNMLSSC